MSFSVSHMPLLVYGIGFLVAALLGGTAQAQDARVIMQTKDKSITVLQASDWSQCDQQVRFAVAAKEKSVFEGSKIQLQKIIGGLRAVTSGTCSKMTAIEIVGYHQSRPVYKGVVRKSEGWRLIPVKKVQQPTNDDASFDNQRFLDLLSRSSGAPTPPVSGASKPDSILITPTGDQITGDVLRDQHAYNKLTQNIEQTLGLPMEMIAQHCADAQAEDLNHIKPSTKDLIYRLCRAVAFSNGDVTLANDADAKISGTR